MEVEFLTYDVVVEMDGDSFITWMTTGSGAAILTGLDSQVSEEVRRWFEAQD